MKRQKEAGAIYVPSFGLNPPGIAGEGFGLFDLVLNMSGLSDFEREYKHAVLLELNDITVPVLALERIIVSERAANRKKNQPVLPVLQDAARTVRAQRRGD